MTYSSSYSFSLDSKSLFTIAFNLSIQIAQSIGLDTIKNAV